MWFKRFLVIEGDVSFQGIVRDIAGGCLTGLVAVTFAIAYAALMFSGPLAPHLPVGLGITFTSTLILAAVIGLRSVIPFAAAGPDSNSSVIIAATGVAIAAELPPDVAAAQFAAFIMLATLACGVTLLLCGIFRLGRAVRFIPFPVIAGFMSTIGLLIIGSALGVCNGRPLHLGDWLALAAALHNPNFIAGIGFAVVLFVAAQRIRNPLVTPVAFVLGVSITHLVIALSGSSIEHARALGWLFPALSGIEAPNPPAVIADPAVDWRVMAGLTRYAVATVIAVTIGMLLNETGIEAATNREIDIDHELRWHGIANAFAALAGGSAGNVTLSRTSLNQRCGGHSRLSVLAMLAVVLALFEFGRFVSYLPPFILGGVLVALGLSIAQEWLLRTRVKLALVEYGLVCLIAAIGAFGGVNLAVAAGLVIACLLFAIACAQVPVIRNNLSGRDHRSRLTRPMQQSHMLQAVGEDIHILILQGFIFFGTANTLLNRVNLQLKSTGANSGLALVLDFGRVTGLDSAAALALVKVRQLVERRGGVLALAALSFAQEQALRRGGMMESTAHLFNNADAALEWCEDRALSICAGAGAPTMDDFAGWLSAGLETADTSAIMRYLQRREWAAGDIIVKMGAEADSLMLVESGRVDVVGQNHKGETVRLRSILGPTVIGEIAVYVGGQRTATVMADTLVVAYVFSSSQVAQMEREEPSLAIAFHRMIVRIEAERLRFTSHELETLLP
jgi:SulP family sulfate permease